MKKLYNDAFLEHVMVLYSSLLFYVLELMKPFTMGLYSKGAYIKYVGGGDGEESFRNFSKNFLQPRRP